jgi:putative FmdB family regulatory protein
MPKYVYYCETCSGEFEINHGMKEKIHSCKLCNEQNSVQRIPQMTAILYKEKNGAEVKRGIEDNKRILEEMKKEARSQEHE